jgi:PKD repeat protein
MTPTSSFGVFIATDPAILESGSVAPQAPVANFVADDTTIIAGGTVTFTDLSGYAPTSWSWEKNDGGGWVAFDDEPTEQHPTETFAEGTWSIRLTATNAEGSDDEEKTDYIEASGVGAAYWPEGYWPEGYWPEGYWPE